MGTRSGVFISYARQDGAEFANALRRRLTRAAPDIRIWQDRTDIEGGLGWWRQIEDALERVEFLIIVLTSASLDSEITHREWRAARQAGVCVYPVKGPKFVFVDARLPRWMKKAHIYDLDAQWETFIAHIRRGCHAARVPFMAPPLPTDHVPRLRESRELRQLLLDPDQRETIAVVAALTGAGGFGKTTLAAALCHDDEVINAFDEGILWTTLGRTPNVRGELTRLYAALTGERPGFVSIEDASQALAEKLEHRNCLLVLDDVWQAADLKPFLRGGSWCGRLVTTRQAHVASEARRIDVDEMTVSEAVSLVLARIAERPTDLEPFRRLAHRLGEWPLLLKLAAAAMRQRMDRGDSLAGALQYVNTALDKRGITAFDRDRASDRHEAVTSTIGVSLELLPEEDRRRCAELSIFPSAVPIPVRVAGELWGLDDFDIEEVLTRLDSVSLCDFDLRTAHVHMHDVMRAYFANQLGARAGDVHAKLLAAWPDPKRLPHGYAWRWLTYHLKAVGRGDELRALVADPEWLQAKLDATDIYALSADLRHLSDDPSMDVLRRALQLSSHVLSKDKSQLASQLLARLPESVEQHRDSVARLMERTPGTRLQPLAQSLTGPGGALVRTLTLSSQPLSLAVMPGGGQIAVATSDAAITCWDVEEGTQVWRWQHRVDDGAAVTRQGKASEFDIAVLQDGRLVLGGSRGIAILDPVREREPRNLVRIPEGVSTLAVSFDGSRVLVGSHKGTLRLFDFQTGNEVHSLTGHRLGIASVAISPDGTRAVSGGYDNAVRLWDLVNGTLVDALMPPHDGRVYAVAISADGRFAISGSADRTICIWDLRAGLLRERLSGHRHRVYTIAMSRKGKLVLSGSHDREIALWDWPSGLIQRTFEGHADAVVAVAFMPDERFVLSASLDRTVRVWQLDASDARAFTQRHDRGIHAIAVAPDGQLAVTAGQDRTVRLWDVSSRRAIRWLHAHHDTVGAVAINSATGQVLSGSNDRTIHVWNPDEHAPIRTLQGHADGISALAITPDGTRALSASMDGDVILWNLERGRIMHRWDAHRRGITFMTVTGDWRLAITGSSDGFLKVWDLASYSCVRTVPAHHDGVSAGALSQDGISLLSGGADGTIRLWRIDSGQMVRSVAGHADKVRTLRILADSQGAREAAPLAFSGGYDNYLKVWTFPDLEYVTSFAADSPIIAAASTDGGEVIVAGDAQGCAHFLNLQRPAAG